MERRFFASTYAEARSRFRLAAKSAGFGLWAYPLDAKGPDGQTLTIDVASVGPSGARSVLLVSSGVHGVEGFFGSALQLAWLSQGAPTKATTGNLRIVLVHAVNPHGFAWLRRVNEDNVDLNRNFLLPGQPFTGSAPAYRDLDPWLNPVRVPRTHRPFWPAVLGPVLRHGFAALKNAVAQGQYDFPQGLFFGGSGPTESQRILAAHIADWVGQTERVLHLDLHTGLGPRAALSLCSDLPSESERVAELGRQFAVGTIQSLEPGGVAYQIRGGMGPFLAAQLRQTRYDYLLAEFGTYPALRVLGAMRREHSAHLHARSDHTLNARAKRDLLEVFCPASPRWRRAVIARGLGLLSEGLTASE